MEDVQIVQLFFARAEEAITEARKKYEKRCLAAALRIVPDERDAEECVSDACLRAWNAIPPERPRHLGAYLCRITRNLGLDRCRYNQAAQRASALTTAFEELEACLPVAETPEQRLEGLELRRFLNCFLQQQSAEARAFFIRRYWYGESIAEIARDCGAAEGTVRSSLFRTRNRLREVLEKEGWSV